MIDEAGREGPKDKVEGRTKTQWKSSGDIIEVTSKKLSKIYGMGQWAENKV